MKKLYFVKAWVIFEVRGKTFRTGEKDYRVLGEDVQDAIWNLEKEWKANPVKYCFDDIASGDNSQMKVKKFGINDCAYTGQWVDVTGEYFNNGSG
jgi:hypothetical protein